MNMSVFAEMYDDFCTKTSLIEEPLDVPVAEDIFKEFCLKVENVVGEPGLGLTKIKWLKAGNEGQDLSGVNASSLHKFVKAKCMLSDHESDFIFLLDFESKYKEWCSMHDLSPDVITPSMLQKTYGINQKAITARRLVKVTYEAQQQSQSLPSRIKQNLLFYFSADGLLALLEIWFFRDFFTAIVQTIVLLSAPLAIAIPAIITEFFFSTTFAINQSSTIVHADQSLQFTLFVNPYILLIEPNSHVQGCSIVTVACWFLIGIEAILHYTTDPVVEKIKSILVPQPLQEHYTQDQIGNSIFMFFVHIQRLLIKVRQGYKWFIKFLVFALLGAWLGYIVLALVWFIFAACVKPELYLPYATAAAAFITFVAGKANSLENLQREIKELVMKLTQSQLNELLSESKSLVTTVASKDVLSGNLKAYSSDILDR
jgi:hypothetical protein